MFLALRPKIFQPVLKFPRSFAPRCVPHPQRLATSGLDVYAHNIETVRRLQRYVRDNRAGYDQSLSVLERAKVAGQNAGVYTKTSLMLGLGETEEEIVEVRFFVGVGAQADSVVTAVSMWPVPLSFSCQNIFAVFSLYDSHKTLNQSTPRYLCIPYPHGEQLQVLALRSAVSLNVNTKDNANGGI